MENSQKALVEVFYHQVAILHEGNIPKEEIRAHIEKFAHENELDLTEVLDILNGLIKKEKSESKKGLILE